LQRYKVITPIMIVLVLSTIIVAMCSVGVLQNDTSQKSGLAKYTGYLVGGGTYSYPIRNSDHPSFVTSNLYSLIFADGRTFVANNTLAESRDITFKANYLVYYNVTEPSIAIDIVKIPVT
jgi:hypothetical protein